MNDTKEEQIIEDAVKLHNLYLNKNDINVQALVRYVYHIAYSQGYKDKEVINGISSYSV